MKNIKIKKLNVFKLSIHGIQLIEASAGTGKTFTIVLLFLRLLLGISYKKEKTKKLLIQEILILTFTNAAKEELLLRIKEQINSLCQACIEKKSDNIILKIFLKKITNIKEAVNLLEKAKNNIEYAAVYTIHEFSKKILSYNTFDYNIMFQKKIIHNEESLYLQATQDFWRNNFYLLPKPIIKIIQTEYSEPKDLLYDIRTILKTPSMNLTYKFCKNETIISYHEKNIKKINDFKKKWLLYKNIFHFLEKIHINKRIYNQKNIIRWIKNITIWCHTKTENYNIPLILNYFKKQKIEKHVYNGTILEHVFFEDINNILKKKYL